MLETLPTGNTMLNDDMPISSDELSSSDTYSSSPETMESVLVDVHQKHNHHVDYQVIPLRTCFSHLRSSTIFDVSSSTPLSIVSDNEFECRTPSPPLFNVSYDGNTEHNHFNLSDLPEEVLALICKFYFSERIFGKRLVNDVLPLLHTNRLLRDKIYYNAFIWYDIPADIHHFVKSYISEQAYTSSCFAILSHEKFRNVDLTMRNSFDHQDTMYYYSVEAQSTEAFFELVETLCDSQSLIRSLVVPLPVRPLLDVAQNVTEEDKWWLGQTLRKWAKHFPQARSLRFLSERDTIENAKPNDVSGKIQDLSYYGSNTERFESLKEIALSGSISGFEKLFQVHRDDLEYVTCLSSLYNFSMEMKRDELKRLIETFSKTKNLRRITLESGLNIGNLDVYKSLSLMYSALSSLNLELTPFILESDNWKYLSHSLTNLKKLTIYLYGDDDSPYLSLDNSNQSLECVLSTSSLNGIPLPINLTHLGINNFIETPVRITLDGCNLSYLTYLHAYKVQLSVAIGQKAFPSLETVEYFPERREHSEKKMLDFWIGKHPSLTKFYYNYDWDSREEIPDYDRDLVIKPHPSLKKLKLSCDKNDLTIEGCPSRVSISGIPNSLNLKGDHLKELNFRFPPSSRAIHSMRTFNIELNRCDILNVKVDSQIAFSSVKFNSIVRDLRKMCIAFNVNLAQAPEHDISPFIPVNSQELVLDELRLLFSDQIPPHFVDGISENIGRFKNIKGMTVDYEWNKTSIRGFTDKVGQLSAFNFFNVKSYMTKDVENCRNISNPYLSEMKLYREDLGRVASVVSCSSLKKLHCLSYSRYEPILKHEPKIILDTISSHSIEELKISNIQLITSSLVTSLRKLQIDDPAFANTWIDLDLLPNLRKLELTKISQLNVKASIETTHTSIRHIYIDSVFSLHLHLHLNAPNLRSITLTKISQTTTESSFTLVNTPKLLRKILHVDCCQQE